MMAFLSVKTRKHSLMSIYQGEYLGRDYFAKYRVCEISQVRLSESRNTTKLLSTLHRLTKSPLLCHKNALERLYKAKKFPRMYKEDTCVPQVKDNPIHLRHCDLNVLCAWKKISGFLVLDWAFLRD